ncbi:MAG TPA: cupin domain-containing protein [Pseudonocardiaceae bacterium]|nr:cupin domain-containing protein [Pseudonocardiaceae bacterium]
MQHLDRAGEFAVPGGFANYYVEHLSTSAMSVGTYCVPAGGVDDQQAHPVDEVYVVLSGTGTFESGTFESGTVGSGAVESGAVESGAVESGGRRVDVGPGTTLYVPAGERHRFLEVRTDLTVLVVFAPPYQGRNRPGDHG